MVKIPTSDLERLGDRLFTQWCAESLSDPRLREILEEAFINGFRARDSLENDFAEHAAPKQPRKRGRPPKVRDPRVYGSIFERQQLQGSDSQLGDRLR